LKEWNAWTQMNTARHCGNQKKKHFNHPLTPSLSPRDGEGVKKLPFIRHPGENGSTEPVESLRVERLAEVRGPGSS